MNEEVCCCTVMVQDVLYSMKTELSKKKINP